MGHCCAHRPTLKTRLPDLKMVRPSWFDYYFSETEWRRAVEYMVTSRDSFRLVFLFASLAFQDNVRMDLLRVLVAFATASEKETDGQVTSCTS